MGFYYNGQPVAVLDPISENNVPAVDRGAFEVAGSDHAEQRFTDLSQASPAGRYRWITKDDEMQLQRSLGTKTGNSNQGAVWEAGSDKVQVMVRVLNTGEVVFDQAEDELAQLLEELLVEVKGLRLELELATGVEVEAEA